MKKLNLLFFVAILLATIFSCKKETKLRPETEVTFNINNIEGYDGLKYSELVFSSENLTTSATATKTVDISDNQSSIVIKMAEGAYNFSFEISGTYTDNTLPDADKNINSSFKAYLKSSQIVGSSMNIDVNPFLSVEQKEDFVIEEIFYVGTVYPETNKGYLGDTFIKITNNSTETLYADGLVISESTFNSSSKYDYTPNIMEEASAIQTAYRIPGDGKTHAVEAGKSLIISDRAMNHKATNKNSFDLSKSDFEWYDISGSDKHKDIDNPDVLNLYILYSYTNTIWTLSNAGNRTYILSRLDTDLTDKEFTSEYKYDYSYIHPATGGEMKRSTYKIPNNMIIDAVTIANKDKWVWNPTSSTLDAGYTSCGINSTDKNRYGKSVIRKKLITENGRVVLKDTNNSSLDFEISTPKF